VDERAGAGEQPGVLDAVDPATGVPGRSGDGHRLVPRIAAPDRVKAVPVGRQECRPGVPGSKRCADGGRMTTVGIATGAGSGMGQACGERVAEMVDRLVLVDIDESSVNKSAASLTARTTRAEVETAVVDVTDVAALTVLAERVSAVGELRAVAHAAGISPTM